MRYVSIISLDFAPEDYTHGYVALYKRANESQWQQEKGKTYKFEILVTSPLPILLMRRSRLTETPDRRDAD